MDQDQRFRSALKDTEKRLSIQTKEYKDTIENRLTWLERRDWIFGGLALAAIVIVGIFSNF